MSALHRMFERMTPTFKEGRLKALWPVFEAFETFLFPTSRRNPGDPHIRDALDFKRMMFTVVVALLPCIVMAFWNTGYQANLAMKELGLQSATSWRSVIMDPIGYDPGSLLANPDRGTSTPQAQAPRRERPPRTGDRHRFRGPRPDTGGVLRPAETEPAPWLRRAHRQWGTRRPRG